MQQGVKMKRRGLHRIVAVILTITMYLSCVPVTDAYAATTKEKLEQAEKEQAEVKDKLEQTEQNIAGMESEKSELQTKLNQLNNDLTAVSEKLEDLESRIEKKEEEIEETSADLEVAKETEKTQYANMKERIQFMYEKKNTLYMEILFSASGFSEFINNTTYLKMLSEYDQNLLEEYEKNRILIEEKEAQLIKEKAELDSLHEETAAEQAKVTSYVNSTSSSIKQYAGQIADAEAEAAAYEADIKKRDEDIAYLKKKLAEEIALSKLAAQSKWRDISEVQFAEGDRYLLANLIYCEAGGEPYAGQLAVGAVVVNRVLSSVYPDTVTGVIYQNKQFSPVGSGRLALALAENRATAACYKAADEAMSGQTNVGNCVYFRTPIEGLTGIRIGGHIFY